MLIFVGLSYGLVMPLFGIVLAIAMPIFYVLGSVASYSRAYQRRAMLSPSELLLTSLRQVIVALRAGHRASLGSL
jgi:hypothetical protein